MLILNDLHLAVQRTGGTTLASQQKLRDHLRDRFKYMLELGHDEVVCNGDFFDGFSVDVVEVVKAYEIIADWLHDNPKRKFYNIQGNHDWHPAGSRLSSWHLMNHFLVSRFGDRIVVFDKGFEQVSGSVYCVPHQANTDIFNLEIERACSFDGSGKFLLLHCNVKNKFCDNSDHSLSINDEQLGNLMRAGYTVVVGHEHVGYTLRGGRVVVVGNQTSSSVVDCLGDPTKEALVINDGELSLVQTQVTGDVYAEINWRELDGTPRVLRNFFRIVGEATAAESADVVSTIAKFRQACCDNVYVVTNAVKVEGCAIAEELAEVSFDSIQAFDILGAIYERLDEKETAVVKELINAE